MGSISKRKRASGKPYYIAWVRRAAYKPTTKSFDTKGEAQAWVDELEKRLKHQPRAVRPDATTYTIKQMAVEYLADPVTTAKRYHDSLTSLLDWWTDNYGRRKVLDLTPTLVREARNSLAETREPATVNRHLAALRSAFNWAKEAEIIPAQYSWPRKVMLPEPKGRTRFLNDAELSATLAAARAHSALMHAAIQTLIGCGLRASELLRLRWSDVDLEHGHVRVLLTKNNESRTVHLPAPVVATLKALTRVGDFVMAEDVDKPLTLDQLESRWRKIRKAAKLEDFRLHDLRHTCASLLAQNGATLLEIGSVLGHKSPAMTQRYAHLLKGKAVTGHVELGAKLV